ncbi:glycosyltransferase [Siccirubricoccus sp. KC 17139]|uniref:Glycosyltransferase n=1 Tax=Siccirubricoccus soli TaxID=2899147 RepID=A0ABT1D7E7_9PROT|nr:glycosyltransferase [Siccirubricoccus soli]MCO6417851.1 glycosyltransferase [Siccirubricoccus soli]MCP2683986.1 glycosyltransferase [Siccirubricoccus soli]
MKVALVHEWLESYAGSERVFEQFIRLWPEADLYAVCDFLPEKERHFLGGKPVRTSFIQRLPGARKHFRKYLGLMPYAVEQFDLSGYDLVVSSSHAVAKGVLTGPDTLHVSYIHSPMRYAWDMQAQYLRQAGMERGLKSLYTRWLFHRLRLWDRSSAAGVDSLIGNSRYIADRIRKVWRREAAVIHPPVDVERFSIGTAPRGEHYLIASRMVPYKRVELVAEAFRRMPHRKLIITGDGPNLALVQAAASGASNIELRGHVAQAELVSLIQTAKAFVFAAEEDFGIGMVEAQAAGAPLIAFGRGGAKDIVRPETGVLFPEQSADSIIEAVQAFEAGAPIAAEACRENALRFSAENFRRAIAAHVQTLLRGASPPSSSPHQGPVGHASPTPWNP